MRAVYRTVPIHDGFGPGWIRYENLLQKPFLIVIIGRFGLRLHTRIISYAHSPN
jgi:hypothetical protein